MAHTLAEKILLSHCDADDVAPGDLVMVRCDVVLTNDISGPMAFRAMKKMGVEKVFDPAKVVVVPDQPLRSSRSLAPAGLGSRSREGTCTLLSQTPGRYSFPIAARVSPASTL